MPELPEVETIIKDLKKAQPRILGAEFVDVWTDSKKIVQKPNDFQAFRKQLIGLKIKNILRRGKNIIFELSYDRSLLIHQKLTGHLLYGKWHPVKSLRSHGVKIANDNWQPVKKGPLEEKINSYIHLLFILNNGQMLALSDLRKFAKVELWDTEILKKEFCSLGFEPLEDDFTFEKFKEILSRQKKEIKQVLMDQKVIAGIGNIYSDEILWQAKIHPFKRVEALTDDELKCLYDEIKKILKKAIKLRGTSISDYRDLEGEKGFFDKTLNVYRREGKMCSRCGRPIERKKIGGRSAHFCPKCQN